MPRNKDPAVLFYPADFLSATLLWSDAEMGMYFKLLCLQFLQNGLTLEEIETVCGDNKKVRSKFQECEDGLYRNPRMAEEAEKRRLFTESRRKSSHARFTNTSNETSHDGACDTSYDTSYDERTTHRMININENINKNISNVYGLYRNILLTDEELKALQAEFPNDWQQRIEKLSEYIASSGKVYDSHLATIRLWAKTDEEKRKAAEKDKPRHGNFDPEEALEAAIRRSRGDA